MATCKGSGLAPSGGSWRDPNYHGGSELEGFRAACHVCYRTVAVTPVGGVLIRHSDTPPRLTGKAHLNALYEDTYNKAKAGDTIRPSLKQPIKDTEIKVWLEAYLDGVGDSGADGRKVGALKRWLRANHLSYYLTMLPE